MKKATIALALVTLLAVPLAAAHAGGGGAGLGGAFFFQCYHILDGMNPPHVVGINDQFGDVTPKAIGQAKLLCTPADGTLLSNHDLIDMSAAFTDHVTCYEVRSTGAPAAIVTLTDTFGVQTVRLRNAEYACTVSVKECVEGCPVVDAP